MAEAHETIAGQVIEDIIVPAGDPWSAEVRKGDIVRLIDLEGQQAVDFLCYNLEARADRYNAANTIKLNSSIYLESNVIGCRRYHSPLAREQRRHITRPPDRLRNLRIP